MTTDASAVGHVLPGPSDDLLAKLEGIYRDIHANPELSMQEHRTSGIAAAWLRERGYDVTEGVGGTGVVGLLRNGDGPTVLLRADSSHALITSRLLSRTAVLCGTLAGPRFGRFGRHSLAFFHGPR